MNQSLGETKQKILRLLLSGGTDAEELAGKLETNLSVARRHLEDLTARGFVMASFERRKRGRPGKLYSITTEGRAQVSSRYDMLAELLTSAAYTDLGPQKLRRLYDSAGRLLAQSVGDRKDPDSLQEVLVDFGFLPELRTAGGKNQIVSRNCPILSLSKRYPELACDVFHTVFLQEALGRQRVALKQAIARGAPECVHEY